jgi:hypothetical protein
MHAGSDRHDQSIRSRYGARLHFSLVLLGRADEVMLARADEMIE